MANPEYVDRINNPEKYPYITNPDGSISTHRMAAEFDEDSGRWITFPMIQMQDGNLRVYEDDEVFKAMFDAMNSGNFLAQPDKDTAMSYAQGGYKTDALRNFGQSIIRPSVPERQGILDYIGQQGLK